MPDQAQFEAITWGEKPLLLIAGPGSGKTYTLVHRIQYLIQESALAPDRILVITFTREAAKEMQGRFLSSFGDIGSEVHFGTFHAFFFQILRQSFGFTKEDLLSSTGKLDLLQKIIPEKDRERFDREKLFSLEKEISHYNHLPEQTKTEELDHRYGIPFLQIRDSYMKRKRESKVLDFDDMMTESHRLLKENKEELSFWKNRFDAILVDEAQDMNQIQYDMLRLLYREGLRLFLVGDDDQSIYGFRGSDPGLLSSFTKDFSDGEVRFLTTNYRSNQEVVTCANRLILHNKNRFYKEIVSAKADQGKISYVPCKDALEEAEMILDILMKGFSEGRKPEQDAILFRNRMQADFLRRELLQRDIPFVYREEKKSMFDHFIFLDLESYLRISIQKARRGDFLRIWNQLDRFLPRDFIGNSKSMEDIRLHAKGSPYEEAFLILQRKFSFAEKMEPFLAAGFVLRALNYEEYLKEEALRRHIDFKEFSEKIDFFLALSKKYVRIESFLEDLEKIRKREAIQKADKITKNGISLLTFHGSKGLEFDRIHIMDAVEGITPSKKATNDTLLEEERRMFYVALTRAREEVVLYTIQENFNATYSPSRFLREMKETTKVNESYNIS